MSSHHLGSRLRKDPRCQPTESMAAAELTMSAVVAATVVDGVVVCAAVASPNDPAALNRPTKIMLGFHGARGSVITIFSDLGISDLEARVASGGLDHMAGQVQGPGASLAPLARAWARGGTVRSPGR
jgi:hypothetical protein